MKTFTKLNLIWYRAMIIGSRSTTQMFGISLIGMKAEYLFSPYFKWVALVPGISSTSLIELRECQRVSGRGYWVIVSLARKHIHVSWNPDLKMTL